MMIAELLFQCLRHFVHLDESNAAIHCAPVRYSPITFRLAEVLMRESVETGQFLAGVDDATVQAVLSHVGQYAEDTGR